jgi:hypothetical protein
MIFHVISYGAIDRHRNYIYIWWWLFRGICLNYNGAREHNNASRDGSKERKIPLLRARMATWRTMATTLCHVSSPNHGVLASQL